MSIELESVVTLDNEGNQRTLYLTSFYGGDKRGHCLKVTASTPFGAEYVQLTKDDAVKLIGIISECFGLNITDAAAAAVQQEREANTTIIHSMADGYRFVGSESMDKIAEALDDAAAAIRARNGAQEQAK